VIIDGKYITFVIQDDFVMKYGDSKAFYIYADIIGGEANDVVQFRLDQTTDISAFEVDTNAALFVQIEGSEDYLEAYKLIEGDNIITRRSDSPSSRFIPNDADYETVLIANLYLSAAMDIDNFRVFRDSTSTALATDIDNVRLYINGRQIDSVSTTGGVDGTYGSYYEFSTFETLQGSNEIRVAVDTTQAAVDGRNFKVTIRPQSIVFGSNAEYVSSQNTVPVADISGIADGGTMTIKKPAVQNVTRTDSYGSAEEVVKGANNFEMIKFAVQANAAGRDLIINSFNVVANVTSGVSTAAVYVDGKMVDTTSFGGVTASFSSLDINVPQGGTTEVSVMVSINTSYLTGAPLVFTVNSFDVDDSEGNTVTNSATVTSATFTVLDSASLIGLINNDTPDKAVITAGTTYDVAYFELEAISDDALVQELTFLNVANAYALDVATGGVATITGADGAIVYAYDAAGNLLGTSTLAEGVAYFSFANPILLERENDGTLIVLKVQPKAINNQTDTNATIKFAVLEVGETVAGTQRTFITSVANGEAITAGNTTWTKAYSETQYVRKTNLVVSNVTAPTSTLLTNGIGKELFAFNAASNNGAKALVKELRIDVDLGGNARLSSFEIYQGNTKLTASQATFVESTANCSTTAVVATLTGGDNCLSIVFTGTYVNGYEVSSSKKFTLRASVAGATAGGDSVSMRISEVSTTATKFTHTGATAELTSLVWSDRAADNTTLTSVDWFTDAFVEVIPTNSWSFSASN